jgi:hypothetical protein
MSSERCPLTQPLTDPDVCLLLNQADLVFRRGIAQAVPHCRISLGEARQCGEDLLPE